MYSAILQSCFTWERQTPEHKKITDNNKKKKYEKAYKNNTEKQTSVQKQQS